METSIEPKAAIVLASAIPAVSALDDLHATMDRGFADMHRRLDRQRNLMVGTTVLIILVTVVTFGIAASAAGG